MGTPESLPINLANRQMGEHRHICAFFNGDQERMDTITPFLKEGIDRGEQAVYIVDPAKRADYIQGLKNDGIDVDAAMLKGQLDVCTWFEGHLRPGYFDQHATVQLIKDLLAKSREDGYPLARVVGCMEWCLGDHDGIEDVIEYESRVNYLEHTSPLICTYDVSKYRADIILGILQTHPSVIINGTLQVNPFYIHPDDFISQWRAKNGHAPA